MTGRSDGPVQDGDVIGSCPLDCPDACSWVVTVKAGVATKLRGNPDHPFTRGGLCKKVNPWLEYAADPGRLLHPMRRVKPKGSDHPPEEAFERISWDEALAEIAGRFQAIIDTTGPAAIWPFSGTGNVGFVQGGALPMGRRLWNHLGVSGHQVTICSISGHVGLSYSTGTATGMDPEDLRLAGTILIWGSNTLIANQHAWPFIEEARANGATIVVVDPVRTRTAARADMHIAPRVGTDGALALGLCRAIIDAGGHDKDFLADRSVGFDEFTESLEQWTIEATAEICGISPEEITSLAATIMAGGPLAVKLGQGMQRSAYGGQTSRIISCLPAITGAFLTPGGGLVYSTSSAYGLNVDRASGGDMASRPRYLAMTNLVRNLNELRDPPIEALFIDGANPVVSNPDTTGVTAALGRPDLFTVAVEIYHTETTDYADIVLPSTMQHEQLEVNDSFSHLYVNLNVPAVAAPGECLSHTEISRRLAKAMNLTEPSLYASDLELAAALFDTPAFAKAGITVESLQRRGWARVPNAPKPYLPFAESFPTPSGRFEFASDRGGREGHGRLPTYRPPAETAGSKDGYDLVAIASDWHINSVFAGTEKTRSRTGRPPIAVHPVDASRDNLVSGAEVVVANDRGSFQATVVVDRTARPGVAVTTKGWWRMGVNRTVAERDSDMGRGAVYHDNHVTIRPVSLPVTGPSAVVEPRRAQ